MGRSSEKKKNTMDIEDLRAILADEITKLRNGETSPANINAITNASGKIFSSVKLEMEYAKLMGMKPNINFIKLQAEKTKLLKN